MIIPNKIFDILKWIAIIVLPSLATLITVTFGIWGLENGDAIAQTITAVGTFLGAVLCVSSVNYKKGEA